MCLFDDIDRYDGGPALHAEPRFTYLKRSARVVERRVRKVLETWFSHYPPAQQTELRARFRSTNDFNHLSAFFELFLYELLTRLRCQVQIHPSTQSTTTKHPDFLVESPGGERFYMEAVVATDESSEQAAAKARMNRVYDVLNRLESPNFFIGMKLGGAPSTPPPARRIREFLAERLAPLNPDDMAKLLNSGGFEALPHWQYEHQGWRIDFFPIPKSADGRGTTGVRPLGMWFHEMTWVTTPKALRDAIVSKAGRYGELDLPYVIAVDVCGHPLDDTDAMEALFGTEQWVIPLAPSRRAEVEIKRAPNGAWTSESGPRYTRVSAVLLVHHLTPWHVPKVPVRLYHNPWARRPYSSELTCLPQALPQGSHMELRDGQSLAAIFGLPLGWPEE